MSHSPLTTTTTVPRAQSRQYCWKWGQILGSYQGKFAVIGGAVPWLLLDNDDMHHVGTIDIDLALDAEALGDGEYATMIESLLDHGYEQRKEFRRFQLVRIVPGQAGEPPVNVIVDFLMPRDADIEKNQPPLIDDFAVIKADAVDLALEFSTSLTVEGTMPGGASNSVTLAIASIPALLAMKGHAINNRLKHKDAYDIYYCVRNFPGGHEALAEQCVPLLARPNAALGYRYIAAKFGKPDSFGPFSVKQFVSESDILDGRTPDQW